jgi:hypothetical protein
MTEDELHTILVERSNRRTGEVRSTALVMEATFLAKKFSHLSKGRAHKKIERKFRKIWRYEMSTSDNEILQFVDEQLGEYKELLYDGR